MLLMQRTHGDALPFDADELRIVAMLAEGMTSEAIARRLQVSERTLRRRVRTLCTRAGVDAPIQLVVRAIRSGQL